MNAITANITRDFIVDSVSGEAFISQRKCTDVTGVPNTTIQSYIKNRAARYDTSRGIEADLFGKVVQYYAFKGNAQCQELMSKIMESGAKAYIYHQAGFTLKATPTTPLTALELARHQVVLLEQLEESQRIIKQEKEKVESLTITLDEAHEWSSVKRQEKAHVMKFSWRELTNWGNLNGYERKEVFDQNYGTVKSYHKDVWHAVYGITIQ